MNLFVLLLILRPWIDRPQKLINFFKGSDDGSILEFIERTKYSKTRVVQSTLQHCPTCFSYILFNSKLYFGEVIEASCCTFRMNVYVCERDRDSSQTQLPVRLQAVTASRCMERCAVTLYCFILYKSEIMWSV